jgi:hypothetical protein
VLRLEVSPEAFALFKDAMARLRRETDAALTEEDALAELCRRALRSGADVAGSPYQIALTVCEHCGRTWHETGGESVELPAEVGERAACDAQLIRVESWDTHVGAEDAGAVTHVGAASEAARSATHVGAASTEAARSATHVGAASGGATGSGTHVGAASGEATGSGTHVGAASGGAARSATHVGRRATRTIPPATRRLVVRRDRGKCRVPGCRSGWLDVHHLRPRAEGGTHHPSGLILLCGGHHALHHRGLLVIDGATESEARFSHADGTPYGAAPRPAQVEASAEAYAALRSLGFRETESRTALAAARTHVGAEATAEELVRAALRARAAA